MPKPQEAKPDLENNLVLVAFAKKEGTENQPGYSLKFKAPLVATEVGRDDEAEIKKPQHGILKITSSNLFDGPRTVTMTGKLKRRFVAAKGDSPAFQTWAFRMANAPDKPAIDVLVELAMANGDVDAAAVTAEFFVKEPEKPKADPEGPELFGDEGEESPEAEIERIKGEADPLGEEATKAAAQEFDQGQAANVRAGSPAEDQVKAAREKRKRKVAAEV